MGNARRLGRTIVQTSSRIAQETSAHQRYAVHSVNDDGTLNVAQPHWPAGETVKIPWANRSKAFAGNWILASRVDGTLEGHDFSAYGGGELPA